VYHLIPRDIFVRALLSHPIFAAREALRAYHRDLPEEDYLDALADVAAAYVPEVETPKDLADSKRVYRMVEAPERRAAHLMAHERLFEGVSDEVRKYHRSKFLGPEDEANKPFSRADHADLAAGQLDQYINKALRRCEMQDQRCRALAFEMLTNSPDQFAELLQWRRPGGRQLPVGALLQHWKHVRLVLTRVLSKHPHSSLLYPQERDWWREHRRTTSERFAAAYFTWERSGCPGALSTFARKVGVNVSGISIETDPALLDRYSWSDGTRLTNRPGA
jgi:hypothetical protein